MAGEEMFNKEMKSLHEILNDGNVEEVRKLRQTKVFSSLLSRYGVELIERVSKFLDDERLYKCPNIVECYEEILKLIIDEINPGELFVTLLEQVDEENCCLEKFLMLLVPLKFSLVKLGCTRNYWLRWTLSTIKYYLNAIPHPEDHEVEFDEKKMLVNDKYIDSIILLCQKLLEFYQTFLDDTISEDEIQALIVFGFHVLTEPAMFVYLEKFEELQQICDQVVIGIDRLYKKVYDFLQFIDERKAEGLGDPNNTSNTSGDSDPAVDENIDSEPSPHPLWDKLSTLPLAVYYSVCIKDECFTSVFPCVYCPLYLFHKLLYLSIVLMKHSHNAVVRKGLLLCNNIIKGLQDGQIPYYYLDYKVHKHFIKIISHLCVYSYISDNRKLAMTVLQMFIRKFDVKGTYLLFLNITSETANEDVDGEIITTLRNMIFQSYLGNKFEYYHKGKLLIDLLKSFANLSNGVDTDLAVSKNKIISFLHLLAVLIRCDTTNQTTIHDYFDYFEETYYSVIRAAIEKSREKYKRAVNSLNENRKSSIDYDNMSVVVEGKSLPRLKRKEKMNATLLAFSGLNLIEEALKLVYEYSNRRYPH